MKMIVKQSNLPVLLLGLYVGKVLIHPATVFDGIAVVALSCLFGFKLYMDHIKKPDFDKEMLGKIDELRSEINNKIVSVTDVNKTTLEKFDSRISAIALSTSPKTLPTSEFKW